MKLLFALLALCVATLVWIVGAVFVRVRKHRRQMAVSGAEDETQDIPATGKRSQPNA